MSLNYPKKVVLGDISVRDGLQHEEMFIPTRAKLWLAEQLILAGFKRIEVTNFGSSCVLSARFQSCRLTINSPSPAKL